MSKAVAWNNVILGDLKAIDDEQLDAARRTAECHTTTLGFGMSAIGHLLAVASASGEMGERAAQDAGWLLEALGELSATLADVSRAAYEQGRREGKAA